MKNKISFSAVLFILILLGLSAWFIGKKSKLPYSESLTGYEIATFYGTVHIFSSAQNKWITPERGGLLNPGDRIKTGSESEIYFGVGNRMKFKLPSDSEIFLLPSMQRKVAAPAYRAQLSQGSIYAATKKQDQPFPLEIFISDTTVSMHEGVLLAKNAPQQKSGFVGVLRGSVAISDQSFDRPQILKPLEKIQLTPGQRSYNPVSVTLSEYKMMREAYDLFPKTAASEALQMDLCKKAGNLFDFVFDHGDFFTPEIGFAGREFVQDEQGEVHLDLEYDVFPDHSFVGIYFKTRGLDLSKYSRITFEARRMPDTDEVPNQFKIEMKSNTGIVRSFVPRMFRREWNTYSYPLTVKKSTNINEIAFVFMNETVGRYKKGYLQLRRFHLEPAH